MLASSAICVSFDISRFVRELSLKFGLLKSNPIFSKSLVHIDSGLYVFSESTRIAKCLGSSALLFKAVKIYA